MEFLRRCISVVAICIFFSSFAMANIIILFPMNDPNAAFAIALNENICGGCGQDFRIPIRTGTDYNGSCPSTGPRQSMIQCSTAKTRITEAFTTNVIGTATWVVDRPRQCLGTVNSVNDLDFDINVSDPVALTKTYTFKNTGEQFKYKLQLPAGVTSCISLPGGFECS